MPNHVANDLTVRGDPGLLTEFMAVAREDSVGPDEKTLLLSANRFIPMPVEIAKTESGSFGEIGYAAWYGDAQKILDYPWIKDAGVTTREGLQEYLRAKDPGYEVQANLYKSNLEQFGYMNWYDWSCANWGTKWGIYDAELVGGSSEAGRLEFTFLSAWSPPIPVVAAMSGKFPGLRFELRYYESGAGFQGREVYKGGKCVNSWLKAYKGSRGG